MVQTNREPYIHDHEDFPDNDEAYLAELEKLTRGSLTQSSIETKSIDFKEPTLNSSHIKKGAVNRSYVNGHEVEADFENIASPFLSKENKLSQEYMHSHEDEFDEQENNTSSKGDSGIERVKAEQKVPYDVVVQKHFLKMRTVRCCGTNVFLYEDELGCFEEKTEPGLHVAIRKSLTREMDIKLGKNKMADVTLRIISCPELQVNYDDFDRHTHLINFRNCVLDLRDESCSPHSPNHMFTSYIDAEYADSTTRFRSHSCNGYYFLKFLEDCTGGDPLKMKSLQQLTGYIISNEWRAKKFFVLWGVPHSGKSVWLSLWRSLVGEKHTTAM